MNNWKRKHAGQGREEEGEGRSFRLASAMAAALPRPSGQVGVFGPRASPRALQHRASGAALFFFVCKEGVSTIFFSKSGTGES